MRFVKDDLGVAVSFTGVSEVHLLVYRETILQFESKEGLRNFQLLGHGISVARMGEEKGVHRVLV
jgi:hypothetical protein